MASTAVDHLLTNRGSVLSEAGDPIDDIDHEVVAVEVVAHDHVEGGRRRAFLDVAAHVEVVVSVTAIREAMDQPRVAVIGEDDRHVGGEDRVELRVRQSVWMSPLILQAHQIDDIHEAHAQRRQQLAQQRDRGQGLDRRHIARRGQHDVGVACVVAGPVPDAQPANAVQIARPRRSTNRAWAACRRRSR